MHSFQSQRTGRARQSLCQNQKAMICLISKRFLGHYFFNPNVLIVFASLPSLSNWQWQSLHPPQHASKQALGAQEPVLSLPK